MGLGFSGSRMFGFLEVLENDMLKMHRTWRCHSLLLLVSSSPFLVGNLFELDFNYYKFNS